MRERSSRGNEARGSIEHQAMEPGQRGESTGPDGSFPGERHEVVAQGLRDGAFQPDQLQGRGVLEAGHATVPRDAGLGEQGVHDFRTLKAAQQLDRVGDVTKISSLAVAFGIPVVG